MPDLFIERVDLTELDYQRRGLATIPRDKLTPHQKDAIEGIQNMLDAWSDKVHRDRWNDNSIQFPRLLCEIRANIPFATDNWRDLLESMDLTLDELDQLFDRAQEVWTQKKEEHCG